MKVLKIVLGVIGIGLLIGGLVDALITTETYGNRTEWNCEEPSEPAAENGMLMDCQTSGGPGLVDAAVPITISLLGLGLVVVSTSMNPAPRRAPATPSGQQAMPQYYQHPGHAPDQTAAAQPGIQPQQQPQQPQQPPQPPGPPS